MAPELDGGCYAICSYRSFQLLQRRWCNMYVNPEKLPTSLMRGFNTEVGSFLAGTPSLCCSFLTFHTFVGVRAALQLHRPLQARAEEYEQCNIQPHASGDHLHRPRVQAHGADLCKGRVGRGAENTWSKFCWHWQCTAKGHGGQVRQGVQYTVIQRVYYCRQIDKI